jgi:hypothetical protein
MRRPRIWGGLDDEVRGSHLRKKAPVRGAVWPGTENQLTSNYTAVGGGKTLAGLGLHRKATPRRILARYTEVHRAHTQGAHSHAVDVGAFRPHPCPPSTQVPGCQRLGLRFTNMIDSDTQKLLTVMAQELDQKTHAQIAVITVESLGGLPIERYDCGYSTNGQPATTATRAAS